MTRRISYLLLFALIAPGLPACGSRTPYLLTSDQAPLTAPASELASEAADSQENQVQQSPSKRKVEQPEALTVSMPSPAVSKKPQSPETKIPVGEQKQHAGEKEKEANSPPRPTPQEPGTVQPTAFNSPAGQPRISISAGDGPQDSSALVRALEAVLVNQHAKALEYLKIYDRPTQELFLRLLPTIGLLSQKKLGELSKAEIAVLQEHLEELQNQLQPNSELVIDQACFCAWVRSFGNYSPLPQNHVFLGGDPNRLGERVQLYVELRNFRNERRNGFFETRLASSVEISGAKGEQLWRHQFDDQRYPISSRSRLHDYYNNYSFYVPPLPAGNYTLTIQIVDETNSQARRTVRKSMPLRVNSLPRP